MFQAAAARLVATTFIPAEGTDRQTGGDTVSAGRSAGTPRPGQPRLSRPGRGARGAGRGGRVGLGRAGRRRRRRREVRERRAAGALPPSLPLSSRMPFPAAPSPPEKSARSGQVAAPGPGRLRPPRRVVRNGAEREGRGYGTVPAAVPVPAPAPAGRPALPLPAAGRSAPCCPRRLLPPPPPSPFPFLTSRYPPASPPKGRGEKGAGGGESRAPSLRGRGGSSPLEGMSKRALTSSARPESVLQGMFGEAADKLWCARLPF